MGCIYSSEGECTAEVDGLEDNICIFEGDPDPSDSCDSYESDYSCGECGQDLNVEECECEK